MKFYNTPEIETLKFAIAEDAICMSMTSSNTDSTGKKPGSDEVYDDDEF